jgi:hypothetical protein
MQCTNYRLSMLWAIGYVNLRVVNLRFIQCAKHGPNEM